MGFKMLLFFVLLAVVQVSKCAQYAVDGHVNVPSDGVTIRKYDIREILFGDNRICEEEEAGSPLEEFPEFFTEEQLAQGAVIIHVIGTVYFFVLLAIICNDYFLPTVEIICEDLNLSKDVAAATFMATATSMPEFFTNTISTLITNSDMGLGTIIGSLMFNTLGVAAIAGCVVSKPVQLDWWPVVRDCTIYGLNIIILICVAWGGVVTFVDSLVMMIFLVIYYVLMFNNNRFMNTVRVFVEDRMNCCISKRYDLTLPPEFSANAKLPLPKEEIKGNGIFVISHPEYGTPPAVIITGDSKFTDDDEDSMSSQSALFQLPRGQSCFMKFWWAFSFPIKALLKCLIPNPMVYRKLYPLTFIMCIVLIGINAYMIVWMLTAVGVTIGVPEIVMGLTFLAAGSTTPEAVSSTISILNGESGIGVSNSLGANSLAILLSLGVPWFIKNCINYNKPDGQNVIYINSQGIEYTVSILLASTIALFVILNISAFRLRRKVGIALFSVYGVLIVLQILIEMNVFFPKKC